MNEKRNEHLEEMYTREVWAEICRSEDIVWNLATLKLYEEHINWEALCGGGYVFWTIELVDYFKDKIDFNLLSKNIFCCSRWRSERVVCDLEVIKKYAELFDWNLLSESKLPNGIVSIDDFLDYWNWEELVKNDDIEWSRALFDKYKKYIESVPLNEFSKSHLKRCLIKEEAKALTRKIMLKEII